MLSCEILNKPLQIVSHLITLRVLAASCFLLATYGIVQTVYNVNPASHVSVYTDSDSQAVPNDREPANDVIRALTELDITSFLGNNTNNPLNHYHKKKSKFLTECPADFLQLVERDQILHNDVYTPSQWTDYALLKHTFWSNIIPRHESQWNEPDTLRSVQTDNVLTNKPSIGDVNGLKKNNCEYNGKVFGIGLFKTGTTSLSEALSLLGYIDNHSTSKYKWLRPYFCGYSHWYLILRHYYDLMHSVMNINNNQLMDEVLQKSQRSFNLGDIPMSMFWPFFDRWYPGSKYILTVRSSTAKFVNSQMKFCLQLQECMNWIFFPDLAMAKNATQQHELEEYTTYKGRLVLREDLGVSVGQSMAYNWSAVTLKDYKWNKHDEVNGEQLAHYVAMIYELHNQRIIEYFREHNRMDDLLILNVDGMSNQEKWTAVTQFLQCGGKHVEEMDYPHANPTRSIFSKMQLLPTTLDLDWKRYFDNKIPVMMTTHTPVRKIWFEYKDTDNYDELL